MSIRQNAQPSNNSRLHEVLSVGQPLSAETGALDGIVKTHKKRTDVPQRKSINYPNPLDPDQYRTGVMLNSLSGIVLCDESIKDVEKQRADFVAKEGEYRVKNFGLEIQACDAELVRLKEMRGQYVQRLRKFNGDPTGPKFDPEAATLHMRTGQMAL